MSQAFSPKSEHSSFRWPSLLYLNKKRAAKTFPSLYWVMTKSTERSLILATFQGFHREQNPVSNITTQLNCNLLSLSCSAMQEYQQGFSLGSSKLTDGGGSLRSGTPMSRLVAGSLGIGAAGFSDPYLSSPKEFGPSPPTGMSALSSSALAGVTSLGGTIGKLFKKPSMDTGLGGGASSSQKLPRTGAEAMLGGTSGLQVSVIPSTFEVSY